MSLTCGKRGAKEFEPPDLLHAILIFIVSQCGRMWLSQLR
jgi:hypothetical protein